MRSSLVSVCIPAYNADSFVAQALDSVKRQSIGSWEVIVTEDGTKDGTEDIVRKFSTTVSQRVVYNRHEANQGLPYARNTGITASKGEWVAFLDADDFWQPEHLELLISCAEKNACDMAFSGHTRLEETTGLLSEGKCPTTKHLQHLAEAVFCSWFLLKPSSVLIKRDAFARFGPISTEFPHANDTEYWLRILRGGGHIAYSGVASCICRDHPGSMSKRTSELFEDNARLCERYSDWSAIPRRVRRSRPAMFYRLASRLVETNDSPKALSLLKESLRADPFNVKTLLSFPRFLMKNRVRL